MAASSLHALLLLSDSALPLGSFAFSSGLESYLAHHKVAGYSKPQNQTQSLDSFLDLSLLNLASTSLPYVLAGYTNPSQLQSLDNDLDASTPCTVARRASIAQGRALLTIWERALCPSITAGDLTATTTTTSTTTKESINALTNFTAATKNNNSSSSSKPTSDSDPYHGLTEPNVHFAPLFGTVCRALDVSEADTAYLFLLNHAKAVISAAVRASVMGPYQAQAVLAGQGLQDRIKAAISRERGKEVGDAGVRVPVMDLWVGRHELLYSRIFNS